MKIHQKQTRQELPKKQMPNWLRKSAVVRYLAYEAKMIKEQLDARIKIENSKKK